MAKVLKGVAAKRWGINAAMISRYAKAGMPVREDGMLDWHIVDRWRNENIVPQHSGSHFSRELLRLEGADTVTKLHGSAGIEGLMRLCVFLKLNGFQTHVAIDAVLSWIWTTLGDREMERLFGDTGPVVDRTALTHLKLTRAESKRLDDLLPELDAALREKA